MAVAATGHITKSSPSSLKILAIVILVGTGGLSVLNQIAAIREGLSTVGALKALEKNSLLGKSIASTERYIFCSSAIVIAVSAATLAAILLYLYK